MTLIVRKTLVLAAGLVCAMAYCGEERTTDACANALPGREHLLAHWKMDDSSDSGVVTDSSGNAYHARCRGTTRGASVPGKIGGALRFPEAGKISLMNPPDALARLTDFTLSLWFQPSSDCWQHHERLFAFTGESIEHCYEMLIDKGAVYMRWRDGKLSGQLATPVLKWKAGEWYHLVFVNSSQSGKSILRSNDLVWRADPDRFGPGQMSVPVNRIDLGCSYNGTGRCHYCWGDFTFFNAPPPIGNPRARCLDLGAVDDIRLYGQALTLDEQLALYDSAQSGSRETGRDEIVAALRRRIAAPPLSPYQYFQTNEAPRLSGRELELKSEWLFQAEGEDLPIRIKKEIGWTSTLLERLRSRSPGRDVAPMVDALNGIATKAAELTDGSEPSGVLALYFQLRQLKRQILFQSPEIDFTRIVCVDCPPPTGNESLARGEMHNRSGSRLLVLEDIAGEAKPRQLAPNPDSRSSALFGFDLSCNAQRVVFCMMDQQKERAYHLYEIGIDGSAFRQITSGAYSDIDPIYLPQGGYAFLSTRGEVYVNCGPWAHAHVLARCDDKGSNIYLLSPACEAEYAPSMLNDGRILYTRWEYVDKGPNRIQSLWTMHPDGTAASPFWGNQSVWPDHLGEARQIPGTAKVLFSATAHHEFSAGCIGIVDPNPGINYPDGLWKVTAELPWPEVGEGPVPVPVAVPDYHTSGQYVVYHTPYPLGDELFLVSAGRGWRECDAAESDLDYKLFLMDIHGNRELIFQGRKSILYAQPVRPRKTPHGLPDLADFPGSEKKCPVVRPGVVFSNDVFADAPPELRRNGKFLRVVESMPKNYSTGQVDSMVSGPMTGLTGPLSVKQVLGTVPIHPDGSVHFTVPPCRMLYFQMLDEQQRCIHTMRSWVSLRPGENRGCVGCHELRNRTPAPYSSANLNRATDPLQPPPWGVRSLSYLKDIQPIFDRACAQCHSGTGVAVKQLDLTLRPSPHPAWHRGLFMEPYPTLLMGHEWHPYNWTGWTTTGYLAVPPVAKTRYDTLPPFSCLSPKSRLITEVTDKNRCGRFIKPEELQMLIAWIDLWALYRSDEELRQIEDPPPARFANWGYPPKMKSAARVRTEYSQDEFTKPADRLPSQNGQ